VIGLLIDFEGTATFSPTTLINTTFNMMAWIWKVCKLWQQACIWRVTLHSAKFCFVALLIVIVSYVVAPLRLPTIADQNSNAVVIKNVISKYKSFIEAIHFSNWNSILDSILFLIEIEQIKGLSWFCKNNNGSTS